MVKIKDDLEGQLCGSLIILRLDEERTTSTRRAQWVCLCVCGQEKTFRGTQLKTKAVESCGCLGVSKRLKKQTTHGQYGTPEYRAWSSLKARCSNPKLKSYKDYGGRGITYCLRWEFFENFIEDMGPRPTDEHTLERKDVNGNYEPDNCEWIHYSKQNLNKRDNRFVEFKGERKTISEWSSELNINRATLETRLFRLGWSVKDALSIPVGEFEEESVARKRPAIPKKMRAEAMKKNGGICTWEGCTKKGTRCEHIIPWFFCLEHKLENLEPRCLEHAKEKDRDDIQRIRETTRMAGGRGSQIYRRRSRNGSRLKTRKQFPKGRKQKIKSQGFSKTKQSFPKKPKSPRP